MLALAPLPPGPSLERTRGAGRIEVAAASGRTRLARLRQSGSARILLPRTHGGPPEAVLLNTAGGLTGGDRIDWRASAGAGAELTVTTQAAERIYRSLGDDARIETRLELGAGACLRWLPQETILFDAARLRRSLAVEMAGDARLVAVETIVLGRGAMGERLASGYLNEQWRVRRDGRLVFADALRAEGDIARIAAGAATLAGARAFSTVLVAAPGAPDRLDEARRLLGGLDGVAVGASAWDGLLLVRMLADAPQALRAGLAGFLAAFTGPLPRVWSL